MAKEYFEKGAAIQAITKDMGPHRTHDFNAGCARAVNRIIELLAADVVEVVRCKDCICWRGENDLCKGICIDFDADCYCSEGKRKDGGQDDV